MERYLKSSVGSDASEAVRALAFTTTASDSRLRLPRRDLRFQTGDEGGIKAVFIEEGVDDAERGFYVADDEKAIVLVDLLTDLSRDKAVAVDFFVKLLRDLSDVMALMMEEEDGSKEDVMQEAALAR